MASLIEPHRATYAVLRPDGSDAGVEELTVAAHGAGGLMVSGRLETDYPEPVRATYQWELEADLTTRLLHITSLDRWGAESELELTVTGNGLLAHRMASDGPTQVELGWGPAAEVDYLSAAFPAVMAARAPRGAGFRRIDVVQVATEDLDVRVVEMELAAPAEPLNDDGACEFTLRAAATGRAARFTVAATGALLGFEGLLRLLRLDPA